MEVEESKKRQQVAEENKEAARKQQEEERREESKRRMDAETKQTAQRERAFTVVASKIWAVKILGGCRLKIVMVAWKVITSKILSVKILAVKLLATIQRRRVLPSHLWARICRMKKEAESRAIAEKLT